MCLRRAEGKTRSGDGNITGMRKEAATAIVHTEVPGGDIPTPVDGPLQRVIVVGAGIAGLVAARALQLAGIDVVVVEGRDRIGGRPCAPGYPGDPRTGDRTPS